MEHSITTLEIERTKLDEIAKALKEKNIDASCFYAKQVIELDKAIYVLKNLHKALVSGQFSVSHSLKVTKSYKWTHQLCEDNKENRLQFFALRHAFEAGVDWCVEECNRKMKETENLR